MGSKNVPLSFELAFYGSLVFISTFPHQLSDNGDLVPVQGKSRCVELLQLRPAVVPQCDEFPRRHSKEAALCSGDGSIAVASLP